MKTSLAKLCTFLDEEKKHWTGVRFFSNITIATTKYIIIIYLNIYQFIQIHRKLLNFLRLGNGLTINKNFQFFNEIFHIQSFQSSLKCLLKFETKQILCICYLSENEITDNWLRKYFCYIEKGNCWGRKGVLQFSVE